MRGMTKHVTSYYPRALRGDGGVTNSVWLWVESLRTAGVEVEVCYDGRLAAVGDRRAALREGARPVRHLGAGRLAVPVDLIDPAPKEDSLLLLHSGYVAFNLWAAARARARRVPYVVTPSGAYDPHVRATRKLVRSTWERAERRMLEQALAVHVFFAAEVPHVHAVAPAARVVTSPTAFPLPEAVWRGTGQTPYVAWLGRYDVRHKGLDRLIAAMAHLPANERPRLRLHGRDSKQTREQVQALVDSHGLGSDVTVGGPVVGTEKVEFLLSAAAYVFPSRWESYGIALVEALALGVPCITTTDANLAEGLRADGAASVVDGSVEGLAAALAAVARGELTPVGTRGREFVRTRLNHAVAGQQFLEQVDDLRSGAMAR